MIYKQGNGVNVNFVFLFESLFDRKTIGTKTLGHAYGWGEESFIYFFIVFIIFSPSILRYCNVIDFFSAILTIN